MIPSKSHLSSSPNSSFHLSFKSNPLSHQDSTQYSSSIEIPTSNKYPSFPQHLQSPQKIDSNISINLRDPVQDRYFSITDRIHDNKKQGNFEKQYRELLVKFRRRAAKCYNFIGEMREEIKDRDERIEGLEKELGEVLGGRDVQQFEGLDDQKKSEEVGFQANKRPLIVTAKKMKSILLTRSMPISSAIVPPDTHICFESSNPKIANHKSTAAIKQKYRSSTIPYQTINQQQLIDEEQYEDEETFRTQYGDLDVSAIKVFQNKIDILENRIKYLTEHNHSLEKRFKQRADLRVLNNQTIKNLEGLVSAQDQTIFSLTKDVQYLTENIGKVKQQEVERVTKLTQAFVRLNKHNSKLAQKNYNYQAIINEKTIQIAEMQKANIQSISKNSNNGNNSNNQTVLHAEISFLNKQIELYKQQNKSLKNQIALFQQSNTISEALQQKVDNCSNNIVVPNSPPQLQAADSHTDTKQLQQQIETLNYKMEIIDNRYLQTLNTNKQLEQKVKSYEKEIIDLTFEINKLQSMNLELKEMKMSRNPTSSRSLIQSCMSITSNESEAEVKPIIKYYQDEAAKLNKCIRDMKVQLSDRDNHISELKGKVQEMAVKLLNEKKSHEEYQQNYITQHNQLKSKIEYLNKAVIQLQTQKFILLQKQQRHQSTDKYQQEILIDKLSMELTISELRVKDVEVENRNLRQTNQRTLANSKDICDKFSKQKKYAKELEQRIKQLQLAVNQHLNKEKERVDVEKKIIGYEKELLMKQMEINLLNKKICSLCQQNNRISCLMKTNQLTIEKFAIQNERLVVVQKELLQKINKLEFDKRENSKEKDVLTWKLQEIQFNILQIISNHNKIQHQFQSNQKELIAFQELKQKNQQSTQTIGNLNIQIQMLKQKIEGMTDTQLYISTISRKDRLINRLEGETKQFRQQKQQWIEEKQNLTAQVRQLSNKIVKIIEERQQEEEIKYQLEIENKELIQMLQKSNTEQISWQLKYGNLEMETKNFILKIQKKNQSLKMELEGLKSKQLQISAFDSSNTKQTVSQQLDS